MALDIFLIQIIKVGMIQGILGGDALPGVILQKELQQLHTVFVQVVRDAWQKRRFIPGGEGGIPILQLCHTWPDRVIRRPELAEYLVELINFRISGKEWLLIDHFRENGANRPDIDRGRVGLRAHQYFWRPIPQRDDFMRERTNRGTERPGQTKVGNLQDAIPCNQQVLRLEVAMHDPSGVAKGQTAAHLKEVRFHELGRQHALTGFHVLFQVLIEKFKDQIEATIFLDAIFQFYNILMRQFPQ